MHQSVLKEAKRLRKKKIDRLERKKWIKRGGWEGRGCGKRRSRGEGVEDDNVIHEMVIVSFRGKKKEGKKKEHYLCMFKYKLNSFSTLSASS